MWELHISHSFNLLSISHTFTVTMTLPYMSVLHLRYNRTQFKTTHLSGQKKKKKSVALPSERLYFLCGLDTCQAGCMRHVPKQQWLSWSVLNLDSNFPLFSETGNKLHVSMSDKIHYHLRPEGSSQKTATELCHKLHEILFKPQILFHCDSF